MHKWYNASTIFYFINKVKIYSAVSAYKSDKWLYKALTLFFYFVKKVLQIFDVLL